MAASAAIMLGIKIAEAVARGIPAAIEAKNSIERMVAEKRDPTPEEWAELNAITDGLAASIAEA